MKRLIASDLDNKQYDLEELYDKVDVEISEIKNALDQLETLITNSTAKEEFQEAHDYANIITQSGSVIYEFIDASKDIGIFNESQLEEGNKIIESLENDLSSLEEELENIRSSHSEHQDEIDNLEEKIDETQSLIEELQNQNIEASKQSKLKLVVIASYRYICNVHDAIMSKAEEIQLNASSIDDMLIGIRNSDDPVDPQELYSLQQLIDGISYIIGDIENDMSIGLKMNTKMGNGIDSKNDLINEITSNIEQITSDLDFETNELENLLSIKHNLEMSLEELESLL